MTVQTRKHISDLSITTPGYVVIKSRSRTVRFRLSGEVLNTSNCQNVTYANISFYYSSDEGNASGFSNSKAQRERFAEYSDFSATNTTVRDEETGFGYFGARYYDSELLTGWMSVDPRADKYPSLRPYNYCAWNPVKLVDSDGRKIRGVTYISERGEFHFTKSAIRCGTDKYVNALLKTNTGNKILMQLINSNKKYSVHVTNRHLFLMGDATGNYSQTSGLYLRKTKTIWLSTAESANKSDNISFPNSIIISDVDGIRIKNVSKSNITLPSNDSFMDAYNDSGMKDFEKDNPYASDESRINGNGVHEGTHALQGNIPEYQAEMEAMENEIKTRMEYNQLEI